MKINSICAEELSQKYLRKHSDNSTYYCNSALVSTEWSASRSGHYVPGVRTPRHIEWAGQQVWYGRCLWAYRGSNSCRQHCSHSPGWTTQARATYCAGTRSRLKYPRLGCWNSSLWHPSWPLPVPCLSPAAKRRNVGSCITTCPAVRLQRTSPVSKFVSARRSGMKSRPKSNIFGTRNYDEHIC